MIVQNADSDLWLQTVICGRERERRILAQGRSSQQLHPLPVGFLCPDPCACPAGIVRAAVSNLTRKSRSLADPSLGPQPCVPSAAGGNLGLKEPTKKPNKPKGNKDTPTPEKRKRGKQEERRAGAKEEEWIV